MSRQFTRSLLALTLCVFQFTLAHAGQNAWTTSGPPGGFFRDIEQNYSNLNVLYAAYGRSFFRTTDGAVNWQTKDFSSEVVDISVDPTDGNRLYIAVLQDGVYRSVDAGQTFTKVAPADSLVWSVGAGAGGTVFYGTGSGAVYRSTNNGDTFSQRTSAAPITLTSLHAYSDVVAALQGFNFALSTDGGATWNTSAVDGTNAILSFTRLSTSTFVATTSNGVFTSPTGAAPWTKRVGGTFYAAVADPAMAGAFFVTNAGVSALWYTTNEGVSFTTTGVAPPLGTARGMLILQGVSSRRFVLANGNGVQYSSDAGATWTESTSGPIGSSPGLATTQAANARIYAYNAADTSGLFTTMQDAGWQRLNLNAAQALMPSKPFGQAALAVRPGAPLRLYMAPFNVGVFRSNDGGSTWEGPGTGLSGLFAGALAFDPANPDIMYAHASQGSVTPTSPIYKSIDQGATWAPVSTTGLPAMSIGLRLVIDPADSARMFLAGVAQGANNWLLYRSRDAGATWAPVITNDSVHEVVLDPGNTNIVYAAGGGGLYTSGNGGDSFTTNTALAAITTQTVTSVKVDPAVPTTIYATTTDPGIGILPQASSFILRSVDRGQTWEKLRTATDQPAWFVGDLLLDPNRPSLIYVTTGGRGIGTYEIVNDLALSIAGHSGAKPRGLPSTFDVNVLNNGALSGTDLHLSVQLPAGLTNFSAASASGTCSVTGSGVQCVLPVVRPAQTISARVTYTPPVDMAVPVSAAVSALERDSVATNNVAQASAIAGEVVDLRVAVIPSATSVNTGGSFSYNVQVSNAGPLASSSATLIFAVASGITLGSPLPAGCSVAAGSTTCTFVGLSVGASQALSFSATANIAGSNVATATVTAAATATDSDASNDTAAATVTVTTPSSGGAGGSGAGGGGAVSEIMVLLMSLLLGARLYRSSGKV